MGKLRGLPLAGLSAGVGCLLVLFGVFQFAHFSSSPTAPSQEIATQPVYFDYGVVFSPKSVPNDAHYLTADQAWMRWENGRHLTPDVPAAFGVLNDQGHYHLVWDSASADAGSLWARLQTSLPWPDHPSAENGPS